MKERQIGAFVNNTLSRFDLEPRENAQLQIIFSSAVFRGFVAPAELKEIQEIFPWFESRLEEFYLDTPEDGVLEHRINIDKFIRFWKSAFN